MVPLLSLEPSELIKTMFYAMHYRDILQRLGAAKFLFYHIAIDK